VYHYTPVLAIDFVFVATDPERHHQQVEAKNFHLHFNEVVDAFALSSPYVLHYRVNHCPAEKSLIHEVTEGREIDDNFSLKTCATHPF
jgi:hypothetical protein